MMIIARGRVRGSMLNGLAFEMNSAVKLSNVRLSVFLNIIPMIFAFSLASNDTQYVSFAYAIGIRRVSLRLSIISEIFADKLTFPKDLFVSLHMSLKDAMKGSST